MGTFTARKPLTEPPGTHWSYASGTTNLISKIHRQTFDSLQAYLNFPRDRLFNKLRMSSAVMEPDVSGTFVGSSYMYATPRDWARIGLLYLQDGVWNGERILPAGWVDYSLTPAPAAVGGHYGAHIWLNRGPPESSADRPHPELPADMYYLSGFEGQSVVVVPSRQLVVVRMGLTGTGTPPIWTLTRQILNAMD
jgi:CubicO group peptidase (beta-lactamase class C family)